MAFTGFGLNGMSLRKFQSHSVSLLALSRMINSDSIVDRAMHIFFVDFHDAITLLEVNTYLLADLVFKLTMIQLVSQNPSCIGGYLV